MAVNSSRGEWKIASGVFDQFTLRQLEALRGQQHFDELAQAVAIGKEANVFLTDDEQDPVIVKIYRLENREFKGMLQYLTQDPRYIHVKRRKREIIFAWAQREYRNLLLAREHIPVPKVIAHRKNVLVMESIGGLVPSPKLKDATPKHPEKFFGLVVEYMKKLRKGGMVHGDLSDFNILNYDEQPLFIDFSQASPTTAPNAQELWDRDVKNVIRAAKRAGLALTSGDFS